ncbi:MAG: thiolase family protein [Chloroflexi bacterium]|uniref:acetyl-CoA C-acetyltransferase n=1 Tax=Candidatus Chlorohelix allophototropha TaxID=3003348 RepID=A0A8T7M5Y3_9CHLR|nr:thiolase family protein [Chloroflexota bacterium]WJW69432.1 thiolase family protein [Chloroflexota bacterium L227-S17]
MAQSAREEVVIVAGARTGVGTFGGQFSEVPAAELGATAIRAAVARAGINGADINGVVMGCAGQVGKDAYVSRAAGLGAGLPIEVPAVTVNRLCGSGLQAINQATLEISSGNAEIMVAGGTENMTRFPYFLEKARYGYRMGDSPLMDNLTTVLSDPFTNNHMGITAENLAEKFSISREDSDAFALRSQQLTDAAIKAGYFKDQITPVTIPQKKGEPLQIVADEHPRPQTTLDTLAKLKPAFKKDGVVTAGNASGINDAAAAVVLMSASKAQQLKLKPKARIVAQAVVGVPPEIMGIGPVMAIYSVLSRAQMTIDQIDMIELNEAFATQALACIRELDLDMDKVNINGGAIALGHPIGATGAILTVKLMYELERRGARFGLITACIGGGQGIATILENLSL